MLDARIALGVQPIALNDPLETASKAIGLRNALAQGKAYEQQQQLHSEQLKHAQLQNQETQRGIDEEQTLSKIYQEAGGDLTKTVELGRQRGLSPKVMTQLEKEITEHTTRLAQQEEAQGKALQQRHAIAYDALTPVAQVTDPAQQEALWNQAVPTLLQAKAIEKEHVVYPGPQGVKQALAAATTAKQLTDAAEAQRNRDKEARDIESHNLAVANVNADLSGKYMKQAGVEPETPANIEAARHNLEEERQGRVRENREQRALDLRSKGSLGVLSDSQKAISQKVAEGDMSFEQLSRLPDKEAIIAGAIEINPDLTRNTFATKKAFTDPASKQSQNLGTISRIVGHIGRFEKNSEELGLSPSMMIGKSLTGSAAAVANDAHAIAGELEKLVSGGVGSVGQIREWQEALKSSRAGIRKAAIDEISQLIGSQYEGMQQTYKTGTGHDLPIEKYVSPEGRKWMAAKGIAGIKPDAAGEDLSGVSTEELLKRLNGR